MSVGPQVIAPSQVKQKRNDATGSEINERTSAMTDQALQWKREEGGSRAAAVAFSEPPEALRQLQALQIQFVQIFPVTNRNKRHGMDDITDKSKWRSMQAKARKVSLQRTGSRGAQLHAGHAPPPADLTSVRVAFVRSHSLCLG